MATTLRISLCNIHNLQIAAYRTLSMLKASRKKKKNCLVSRDEGFLSWFPEGIVHKHEEFFRAKHI